MSRIAILMPGRGAYTKRARHSLDPDHPLVKRAEEIRAGSGRQSLLELDQAKRWESAVHLRPDNVSPLIYVVSYLDAMEAMEKHEAVAVCGNSMGWYSALAVAGALSFEDGFRLVQEMALLQMTWDDGGQVVYPLIDDEWRIDEKLVERVEEAIASSEGEAFPSIALGGYAVLAGTEKGIEHLLQNLPYVEMGPSLYPIRLAQHGPYHTPLLEPVSESARKSLHDLDFKPPEVTLVDGRGARFTPWSTDPAELAEYTFGPQVTTPFGFTTSIRVILREMAPDLLALPGPGNTLGGIAGQVCVMEGYRGLRRRTDFEAVQESDHPVVWSMRR